MIVVTVPWRGFLSSNEKKKNPIARATVQVLQSASSEAPVPI